MLRVPGAVALLDGGFAGAVTLVVTRTTCFGSSRSPSRRRTCRGRGGRGPCRGCSAHRLHRQQQSAGPRLLPTQRLCPQCTPPGCHRRLSPAEAADPLYRFQRHPAPGHDRAREAVARHDCIRRIGIPPCAAIGGVELDGIRPWSSNNDPETSSQTPGRRLAQSAGGTPIRPANPWWRKSATTSCNRNGAPTPTRSADLIWSPCGRPKGKR